MVQQNEELGYASCHPIENRVRPKAGRKFHLRMISVSTHSTFSMLYRLQYDTSNLWETV